MDELKNKKQEESLRRAETQKRPPGLVDEPLGSAEPLGSGQAWHKPERVEHTSEKEHPPGKE